NKLELNMKIVLRDLAAVSRRSGCLLLLLLSVSTSLAQEKHGTSAPAGRVYRNGVVFTSAAQDKTAQAVAIRDGRIAYVGSNEGVAPFIGARTAVVDLKGRFVMPGLIDGHMHPLEAGTVLLKCSLNYDSLTVEEFQRRIQGCLAKFPSNEPDAWLE